MDQHPAPSRTAGLPGLSNLAILFALVLTLLLTTALDARAWTAASSGPDAARVERYVLVKATGAGRTPLEAEKQALAAARKIAAERLRPLGGAAALAEGAEAQRVLGLRRSKAAGPQPERAQVLLELRLRRQQEPLPGDTGLPVLRAAVDAGVLSLWTSQPCEAVAVLSAERGAPADIQPGVLHPTPDAPARLALNGADGRLLGVLACTGRLAAPPANGAEAAVFARFRAASLEAAPEGAAVQCVEMQLGRVREGGRALRQQAPEAPVNMSGAAGRDAGLPAPKPGMP